MALDLFKKKLSALKKKMDMLEFLSEGGDSAKASEKGFDAEGEEPEEEKSELEISIESSGGDKPEKDEEEKPKKKGVMRGGFLSAMNSSMKSMPDKKASKKKGK